MAGRCFDAYKAWVREHSLQLASVEQILSKCMWLLPNRFSESDVGAEACHSLLGLIRLFHESILSPEVNKSMFTWSMALEAIQQVEVLYEMRAGHMAMLGQGNKYTPLAALELLKLFVRLFVLNSSRNLLTTTFVGEEKKDIRDAHCIREAFRSLSNSRLSVLNEAWYSASEKWESSHSLASSSTAPFNEPIAAGSDWDNNREDDSAIELLDCDGNGRLWWQSRRRPEEAEDAEGDVPAEPDSSEFCYKVGRMMMLIGELLYLLRPIVCVLILRKRGVRSWRPWFTSLGMDLASRTLISQGAEVMKYAGLKRSVHLSIQDQLLNYLTMVRNFQWTPVEEKEMKRRKTMFLMYLMRSPVFEIAKPGLETVNSAISYIPVIGGLAGKALELLYGVQRYYVYTSGTW